MTLAELATALLDVPHRAHPPSTVQVVTDAGDTLDITAVVGTPDGDMVTIMVTRRP